jgi:predicted ATPase
MINELSINSFKCFDQARFRLGALTILAGLNSSGKSTVMHSLALLHQTICTVETSRCILLNGPAVSLGTVSSVVCNAASTRNYDFSIGLKTSEWEAVWTAGGMDSAQTQYAPLLSFQVRAVGEPEFFTKGINVIGNDTITPTLHLVPSGLPDPQGKFESDIRSTLDGISYLSAERIGPREVYPVRILGEKRDVGPQGEWTAWCLYQYKGEPVSPLLAIPSAQTRLQEQTGAWLDFFFPGSAFQVGDIPGTNLIKLEFRSTKSGKFHRPQNVGFALSQVLPIIVACLSARRNEVILIENPETHLHPAGQSEMGYFLAMTAASGVQIVVETHSDHVLNGVRRFVGKKHIDPKKVAIHFFGDRSSELGDLQNKVSELVMDKDGKIDKWPIGFFDQITKDLLTLP